MCRMVTTVNNTYCILKVAKRVDLIKSHHKKKCLVTMCGAGLTGLRCHGTAVPQ